MCYALPQAALDRIKAWVEKTGGFLYTEDWGLIETLENLWPEKVGCPHTDDANTQVTVEGGGHKPLRRYGLIRKSKATGTFEQHIIVKLSPGKGNTSHPLMRGVWNKPKKKEEAKPAEGSGEGSGTTGERPTSVAAPLEHQWQIDDESPFIEIKDQQNVIVLLESAELADIAKGNTAVAITFRVGSGVPKDKPKVETGPGGGSSRGTGEWSSESKGGRVLHTLSHYGHQKSDEDGQALHNLLLNFLLEASKRHDQSKG